jgi:hypothetical protein
MNTASPETLRELRALNASFIHNFITNDVAAHDAILHPGFVYIAGNGRRVARAPYLKAWATGFDAEVIPYWDVRDECISVFGPVALVRSTNKYIERHGGAETAGMACYTDTYLRENGVWKCLQAQITEVAPAHWPADETIVSCYLKGVRQPPGVTGRA